MHKSAGILWPLRNFIVLNDPFIEYEISARIASKCIVEVLVVKCSVFCAVTVTMNIVATKPRKDQIY